MKSMVGKGWLVIYLIAYTQAAPRPEINLASHPGVVWQQMQVNVATEAADVEVVIALMDLSPCKMIAEAIGYEQGIAPAVKKCEEIYADVMKTAIDVCNWRDTPRAEEIATELAIMGWIFVGMVVTPLVSAGNTVAVGFAYHDIGKLKDRTKATKEVLEKLEMTVLELEKKLDRNLDKMERVFKDAPSQAMTMAYVVYRLEEGKKMWAETKRKWSLGIFSQELFDFYNFTIPCGDKCRLRNGKFRSCEFDAATNKLTIRATLPVINPKFTLLEAHPFSLMRRQGDQTCSIEFEGPKYVLFDESNGCMEGLDYINPIENSVVYLGRNGCVDNLKIKKKRKSRGMQCKKSAEGDELSFFRYDRVHDVWVVYCPGQYIHHDILSVKCDDDFPQEIPTSLNVTIGNTSLTTSSFVVVPGEERNPYLNKETNSRMDPFEHYDIPSTEFGESLLPANWFNNERSGNMSAAEVVIVNLFVNFLLGIAAATVVLTVKKARGCRHGAKRDRDVEMEDYYNDY